MRWPLHVCALSRSKESSSRQVIGCCLHCRWHTPPPLLDTSVVFIRAEELGATPCYQIWPLRLFTFARSNLSRRISAQCSHSCWDNQKFKWKCNRNVNALRFKTLCNLYLPECTICVEPIQKWVLMFTGEVHLWVLHCACLFVCF